MKILHICAGLPISNQSGIPNYVRNVASNQASLGHDITVLTSDYDLNNTYNFKIFFVKSKIKSFSRGRIIDKSTLIQISNHLKKENYDIIHIHMLMTIDWRIYSILKNYNYVVSLHDYWFLCPRITMYWNNKSCECYDEKKCKACISWVEQYRITKGFFRFFSKKINGIEKYPYISQNYTQIRYNNYKKLLEGAKMVLPVSTRVMDIFKMSNISANYKVCHIGNITADNFKTNYSYKKYGNKINIVFLGRLTKAKGVDVLLKIAEKIDKTKFEIHFFGDAMEYKNIIENVGIINHGKYCQVDLQKILIGMDLGFVLPIWEDNGPQVVMEMLNNHIPVIGTNIGGIPDFVISGVNGYLFNPFNKSGYLYLFEFLNNINIDKIRFMSENIKKPTKTTREHFDELLDIYARCTSNNL